MALYEHKGVRPVRGRDVFIADSASVIGDVHLGDEASVWFGAVLRGDCYPIRIGARTNIQDGAVVHVTGDQSATTVGDDVTVGHLALLHGCTVGNRVLVGMGSIVLDDVVIGDECFIAAGSLLTPRTKIPPQSFVLGSPARVVRALKPDELAWIVGSSKLYMGYAATFRTDVKRID